MGLGRHTPAVLIALTLSAPGAAAQAVDQTAITDVVATVVKAVKKTDPRSFIASFDLGRLDRALRDAALGYDIEPAEAAGSRAFRNRLNELLLVECCIWKDESRKRWKWKSAKVLEVRPESDGTEARVVALVRAGKDDLPMQFRVVNDRGIWKVFDYVIVDQGLWLSEFGAIHFIEGRYQDSEQRDALRRAASLLDLLGWEAVQPEARTGFTDIMRQVRDARLPPRLGAVADFVEARFHRTLAAAKRTEAPRKEAEALVKKALAANPELIGAWRLRGEMALAAGHAKEAAEAFGRYDDLHRAEVETLARVAEALTGAGLVDEAVKAWMRVISADPQHEGLAKLVRLLVRSDRLAEVSRTLQGVMDRSADAAAALAAGVEALEGQRAFEPLLDLVEHYRKKHTDDPVGRALHARALRSLGKLEEAAAVLDGEGADFVLAEEIALTAAQLGDEKKALPAARRVEDAGEVGFAYMIKGLLELKRDKKVKGLREVERAVRTDWRLGNLLRREPALAGLPRTGTTKRIEARFEEARGFVQQSEALIEKKDWDGLLALSDARLKKLARDRLGFEFRICALLGKGDADEALATCKKATSKTATVSRPFFKRRRILVLLARNDVDGAADAARGLLTPHSKDPDVLLARASLELAQGRKDDARKSLDAACLRDADAPVLISRRPEYASLRELAR